MTAAKPFKLNECKKCGIHFVRTRRSDFCMRHVPHAGGRHPGPNPFKYKRKPVHVQPRPSVMNQCEACGIWFKRSHKSSRCAAHRKKPGRKPLGA